MNKFAKRTFRLVSEQARESAISLIRNLPLSGDKKPLTIVIEEERPIRKLSQNDLMWAGPLKNIADQAWVDGRQYSDIIWHELFKSRFLPDEFDPIECKDGYVKYDTRPDGERVMIGSTTQLTVKGFSIYLEQLMAFGANLGVQFSANPNEARF